MKCRTTISVSAIAESLLKRKWSLVVLRHLKSGGTDPLAISSIDPPISRKVLNDRLRSLLRYELIIRCSRSGASSSSIEYRLTSLGEKMLDMMNLLEQLDREYQEAKFRKVSSEEFTGTRDEMETLAG